MQDNTTNQKQKEQVAHQSPCYILVRERQEDDEISLDELFAVLVRNKWLIVVITFLFTVGAILYAFSATTIYRAEVLLAPVQKDKSGGNSLSALAGQYGGLAELAGISVPGSSNIETVIATLKSRRFIVSFIKDYDLKPLLFNSNWDSENKRWFVSSPSIISRFKRVMLPAKIEKANIAESLAPGEPTMWDAYKRLNDALVVNINNKSGLVTVQVDWKEPELAARWANALVQRLNSELRQQAILESKRGIRYLNEQIQQTSLADLRSVLYRLVEEHTKNMTLAKVNEQYALKVIDPAVPPQDRAKPNRKLMVVLGFFLGLMLGIISAFVWNFVRLRQQRSNTMGFETE